MDIEVDENVELKKDDSGKSNIYKFCPSCGGENSESYKFCINCGNYLQY